MYMGYPGRNGCCACRSQKDRSSIVRLAVVMLHGGIYLDCDCEVIQRLHRFLDHEAFGARVNPDLICNAVFGAERAHPWVRWQFDRVASYIENHSDWANAIMSAAPSEGLSVLPRDSFYPFLRDSPPDQRQPTPGTYIIHHWAKTWAAAKQQPVHPEPDVPLRSYQGDYEHLLADLRPRLVVEWGPGLNTAMAISFGARVYAFESDPRWLPQVAHPNLTVQLRSDDDSGYFDFPDDADLYFVDGRNRERCLEVVYDRMRPDAVVCLHDAHRRAYRPMLTRFPFILTPTHGFAIATRDDTVAHRLARRFGCPLQQ